MEPETTIQQRLALLLEVACEQFELADKFAKSEITIIGPEGLENSHRFSRSNSIAMMALVKEFLFSSRRAYRLVEQGKGKLGLDRNVRKSFMAAMEPIVDVRDVNEHGSDEVGKNGEAVKRPSTHLHENGRFSVDETSIISNNGKIFMGPLDCKAIYLEVLKMKEVAGFSSLPHL